MALQVEKKYHMYCAHRNKNAGEKCGRIHGHTYDIKCYFEFNNINEAGVTVLFSDIDLLVEPIIKGYCHYFLIYENDPFIQFLEMAQEDYQSLPFETSAENMAVWLFGRIKRETKLPIIKIELAETKSSNVTYEEKLTK